MQKKLQVFVSSTYVDLVEERQAAVSAILKAGHIPAGMELFTAGDKSQLQTIKNWIDQCDVFMLILAGRYGSVESDSGLSYTEIEYNYALENKKPLFSVVIQEDALESKTKNDGRSALELENPKLLSEFRGKVLSNISSFFSDSKDIKLCVHESLSRISASHSLEGWVRASEIPDVKSLNDEIIKLRKESEDYKKKIMKLESMSESIKSNQEESAELFKILDSKKLSIPASLAKSQNPVEMSVLQILLNNYKTLTSGVTNSAFSEDAESFFYFNLMPELMIYDLAESEKVAGAKYRRCFLTKCLNQNDRHVFRPLRAFG